MSNQNQATENRPVTNAYEHLVDTCRDNIANTAPQLTPVEVTAQAPVSAMQVASDDNDTRIFYMENAKGHLIPADKVKPVDKLRDEEVRGMIKVAKMLRDDMQRAKRRIFASFNDFVALSAQEYEVQLGGKKGNTTLISYDGKFKVQLAVSENIVFDERLQVAKSLIDECLTDWTRDSNDNIKAIINQAFQVDKEGKISTHRVLSLRSLDMSDAKWDRAMDAISDAIQVTDTKEYIRFYERDEQGAYHQISLDFSNV